MSEYIVYLYLHCCPVNSLSLRDDCREKVRARRAREAGLGHAGGRGTHGAVAERAGESEARGRGPISANLLILHPLILSFSRREKERLVPDAVTGIHVWRVVMTCLSGFIQDVTNN